MNCAFHQLNPAGATCNACGRGLCAACDHRIKGWPYCQDCIVAGIEALQQQRWHSSRYGENRKAPMIAALMGLVPGLGAVYNGQNIKALLHFAVSVGLWEMADLFNSFVFGMAGTVFFIFSMYDAWKSARKHNTGFDLREEDELLKTRFQENIHLWGGLLIVTGSLAMLNLIFSRFFFGGFSNITALFVIAAGVLLFTYNRGKQSAQFTDWSRQVPPSVVESTYQSDYSGTDTRRFR
jgi:hypothetical protein